MFPTAPEVQSLFNRIAPVYDRLNNQLSFGLHWLWKGMTVQWSGAKPGERGLDLCCGTGDIAFVLAQAVGPTGQVYGVDFAEALLAIAAQRSARRFPSPPIKWHRGDALALDFPDNFFDAVTMGYGLRNVVDIPTCLGEIYRVLKPGKTAAILDIQRPKDEQVRSFQSWFLQSQVVPAATALGVTDEYAYINPSIERFPTAAEQIALATQAGFRKVQYYAIAWDMMGVLVITK